MDRKQVGLLFKQMFDKCPNLEGKSFALMPPNADDVLSKDYQVHIKSELDENTLLCIRRIVKAHGNLGISEQNNLIVIFEPIKSQKE